MDVVIYDSNGNLLKTLYQWDLNQTITVRGISTTNVPAFHFCNRSSTEALVVSPTVSGEDLIVDVPNVLLQAGLPLIVYAYQVTDNDGYRTMIAFQIPVVPRAKPSDYEYEDNVEYISAVLLNSRLDELIHNLSGQSEAGIAPEVLDIRVGTDGYVYQTAGDAVRAISRRVDEVQEEIEEYIDTELVDGLYYDDNTNLLYLTANGEIVSDPVKIVSGGGGGGGSDAKLEATNTTGWTTKTINQGSQCELSLHWSSIENDQPTGNGTLTVLLNNIQKQAIDVAQGNISIDVSRFLTAGTNRIKLKITDVYENSKTFSFTIAVISLRLTSNFDTSGIFNAGEAVGYTYTPVGAVEKTVYFEVDGVTIGTAQVTQSGFQQSYMLPPMNHGAHSLRVWFTAEIDSDIVSSNELFYDLVVVNPESTTPIIASPFEGDTGVQYENIAIPFTVYTPTKLTSTVLLKVGGVTVSTLSVDRTEHTWNYRPDDTGEVTLSIHTGEVSRSFTLTISESEIHIEPETNAQVLCLTSFGRSNAEEHPEIWRDADHNISATLSNFNFVSDGWVADASGNTVLRVAGAARVTIPFQIFTGDFRKTGKTIEIEFGTTSVTDYDSVIFSSMNGGRGLSLTAQKATLTSEQSSISMQYKEDDHIRLSFVVEKRSENRLLFVYVNGIPSGVIQYPVNDDFSQQNPVGISIGSSDCAIDISCIRVYDNDLTRMQILTNWIADTQDTDLKIDRYNHNDVYDDYGNIVIAKLPDDLPYMVLDAEQLPQYKGDKKTITGRYVDPVTPANSFTFTGCQINVQGTSSAPYARKNYDMQFKNGFEMSNGQHADNYALRNDTVNVPFNRFVLKADVASSEGANNVELVRMFCDVSPFKKREALVDPRIRQGIDGFPIVVFWHDTVSGNTTFLGKYNFNLPKRAPGPYGYSGDMESWEFQNNTSELMLFQTDYFDETPYTDPDTGDTKELWRYDYEARFPSDEWTNYLKLQELQSFVYSTYREEATGDPIAPVTYDGVEYTTDSADYRLAKFKAKFGDYAEVNSFIFYYIFTELFLMVDSRAKNLFIGFSGSDTDPNLHLTIDRKAVAEPYDMDTALGTNNEGSLVFGFSLEDTDHLAGGANVFNGQDSVLWNNLRDAFGTEIRQMYQQLRSASTLSYATVENRYEQHQSKWPEAIWIEDAWFKYIDPLIAPDPGKQPTGVYLPMMQGSKAEQRKWWLYNRFRYMDSKWNAGDALSQVIQLRGYEVADITVTPYADIYPTIKYASYVVQERGTHDVPTTLECPLSTLDDTEIYIYSAPQLSSVGDLSPLKVGFADFSWATRLDSIKLGDSSLLYENLNLKTLSLWNVDQGQSNKLIRTLDVRNCNALGTDQQKNIDLRGAPNIEYVYADGTAITSCDLPNGGNLKVLHLPGSITSLVIRNQPGITNVTIPSYANISTLWLDNVSSAVPMEDIVAGLPSDSRVRLVGIDITMASVSDVEDFFDTLDDMRGLDEYGNNLPDAVCTGHIHISDSVTAAEIAGLRARFSDVTFSADHITAILRFYNYNGTTLYTSQTIQDGGDGYYPGSTPTRTGDVAGTYTFIGWSREQSAEVADPNALLNVLEDRDVYAAFKRVPAKYTVVFRNDDNSILQTLYNVEYGTTPVYTGATPVSTIDAAFPFEGWTPPLGPITGHTTYYPKYDTGWEDTEITDDWDTIIANAIAGNTRYKPGNYKMLDIGTEGQHAARIVAKNADELADGSGNAELTFVLDTFLLTHNQPYGTNLQYETENPRTGKNGTGTIGGWTQTANLYAYMTTIKGRIQQNVRNAIQSVKKYTRIYNTSLQAVNNDVSIEDVWLLSARELGFTDRETMGVSYPLSFTSDASRVRYFPDGRGYDYFTRTADTAEHFNFIMRNGSRNATWPTSIGALLIGFCLGKHAE